LGTRQTQVVQPHGILYTCGREAPVRCFEVYLEVPSVEVYRPVVLQGGGDVIGDDGPNQETVDYAEVDCDCHDEEQSSLGLGTCEDHPIAVEGLHLFLIIGTATRAAEQLAKVIGVV